MSLPKCSDRRTEEMNKFLHESFKSYRYNSIFLRYLTVTFAIFFVCFTVITVLLVRSINADVYASNLAQYERTTAYCRAEADKIISSTFASYQSLVTDANINQLMKKHKPNDPEYIKAYNNLTDKFTYYIADTDYMYSIYIYSTANDYIHAMSYTPATSDFSKYFSDMWIFDEYIKTGENPIYHKSKSEKSHYYISFVYAVNEGTSNAGYMAYNINIDKITERFNVPTYLLDGKDGTVLYSSTGETKDYSKLKKLLSSEASNCRLGNSDLFFVFERNFQSVSVPLYTYFIIFIIIMLLAALFAYFVAISLYNNIEKIYHLLKNPFDFSDSGKSQRNNELTYITSNIVSLRRDLDDKVAMLGEAQATALQLQISPHFLFNTLNLISSIAIAELKRDSDITTVVELLSRMLYKTLDTSTLICTLREEIAYTKDYIAIQRYKYYNFDSVWDIPDEMLDANIVKFTLQPVIENAIHHGIASIANGVIRITGAVDSNGNASISVENNGKCIAGERIDEINNHINAHDKPSRSIGLWNTNQRLKLLLGERAHLEIGISNKMTCVKIYI